MTISIFNHPQNSMPTIQQRTVVYPSAVIHRNFDFFHFFFIFFHFFSLFLIFFTVFTSSTFSLCQDVELKPKIEFEKQTVEGNTDSVFHFNLSFQSFITCDTFQTRVLLSFSNLISSSVSVEVV